jgi:hypothetical protein
MIGRAVERFFLAERAKGRRYRVETGMLAMLLS